MSDNDREAERTRAALDISDNLLQDMQGLVLRLHASCEAFETLLDRVDGVLTEARERIGTLAPDIGDRRPKQTP